MSLFDHQRDLSEFIASAEVLGGHLARLHDIIVASGEPLEGNCFYTHLTLNLYPELLPKQLNLYACGKAATTRICEIGFNAGHSALLMLLNRPKTPIEFLIFDIGEHRYVRPALDYIAASFPHVKFTYVEGDSTKTMPEWIENNPDVKFDVIHVDGGHIEHCIKNDMINADKMVTPGGIVIVDDTQDAIINSYADMYIASGAYKELDVLATVGYKHRILQKSKE
jgi:hypothetical protein